MCLMYGKYDWPMIQDYLRNLLIPAASTNIKRMMMPNIMEDTPTFMNGLISDWIST